MSLPEMDSRVPGCAIMERVGEANAFLADVRRSAGASQGRMALRGKPFDNVEGRFLGGTHSVRPRRTAFRMPGHFIPTRCVGERPAAYRPHASVKPVPSLRACGARPSERVSRCETALRGSAGDDAKGDFLGRARSPRPHGTAGRMARHCVATGAFPRSRWPRRGNVGVSVMLSFRACGARPSERVSRCETAFRGSAGDDAKGGFLGGMRSARPQIRAGRKPGEVMITDGRAKGWWPKGNKI